MLRRRLPMHGDTVTVDCKSPDSAADCFPLCSIADCSAFRPPPPPPPPPRPVHDGHTPVRLLLTVSLLSGFLFLSLAFSTLLLYRRRRILRRRRAVTAPLPPEDGFGDGDEAAGGGVVHHVWYIRTVGLDEATIASITTVEYRGGGGGDCTVCLGEFGDGELVRLLPRCAHAFHAPCIDTWLRAHVNCPLCRSPVVASSDPSAAPEAEAEGAEVDEDQVFDEVALSDSQAEGSELSSDSQSEDTATSAEENTSTSPKPIRRSASMDSPLFLVVVPAVQDDGVEGNRKAPRGREVRLRGREKEGCGAAGSSSGQVGRFGIGRSMSSSGRGFFFSRNGRSRGAVLPL